MTIYNEINLGIVHNHDVVSLAQAYLDNGIPKINKADTGVMPWIRRYVNYLKMRHKQRQRRAEFSALLIADDARIKDLGLDYSDVKWAASLPIEINADEAIKALKCLRRQTELKSVA